ncbi:MAG: RsmF rRNA methyltransferase first C-terminal domain-containing protein, partial [Lachnospiraceae bacterium]|nr:RsmF rRNA methyltransferase first C-terminal domain-containing protein [Lachnospiraceae bacterium]
ISNAIVLNETPQRLAERFETFFDKILVDAPCSGEGMFRKNDEAKEEWSPANVEICAKRQDEILDRAAMMLKDGGTLGFSTCTFAEEENEGSIRRFLERHPEFSVQKVSVFEGMEQNDFGVRLWPHKIKGEGHFFSVLKKAGELRMDDEKWYKIQKGQNVKQYPEFLDFCMENGLDRCEMVDFMGGTYITFGEQLYLLPKDSPNLDKLKVLRPGLHVATIKKGRIEPAHALSHILKQNDFKNVITLREEGLEVRQYLNGQTLNVTGNKGWNLVCVNSYGLGFGKVSGGILKNHYPKGLRSLHL